MVYNLLDQYLLGGTQWGWTANWSSELKDGWNRENFSITDVRRNMRSNYAIRPFPRATAGIPGNFSARPLLSHDFDMSCAGCQQPPCDSWMEA